jgi:hypothetical protein
VTPQPLNQPAVHRQHHCMKQTLPDKCASVPRRSMSESRCAELDPQNETGVTHIFPDIFNTYGVMKVIALYCEIIYNVCTTPAPSHRANAFLPAILGARHPSRWSMIFQA